MGWVQIQAGKRHPTPLSLLPTNAERLSLEPHSGEGRPHSHPPPTVYRAPLKRKARLIWARASVAVSRGGQTTAARRRGAGACLTTLAARHGPPAAARGPGARQVPAPLPRGGVSLPRCLRPPLYTRSTRRLCTPDLRGVQPGTETTGGGGAGGRVPSGPRLRFRPGRNERHGRCPRPAEAASLPLC